MQLSDSAADAQSKLAIAMWSRHMADTLNKRPIVISVNPGSFLGTKMGNISRMIAGNLEPRIPTP